MTAVFEGLVTERGCVALARVFAGRPAHGDVVWLGRDMTPFAFIAKPDGREKPRLKSIAGWPRPLGVECPFLIVAD